MAIPRGVRVAETAGDRAWGVVAKVPFKAGEVIFVARKRVVRVPEDKVHEPLERLGVTLGDDKSVMYIDVVPSQHCVPHPAPMDAADAAALTFDVYGFDSLMHHSCDANSTIAWVDTNTYMHVATRDIANGEMLTVHYDEVYYAAAPLRMACKCGAGGCGGCRAYGRR